MLADTDGWAVAEMGVVRCLGVYGTYFGAAVGPGVLLLGAAVVVVVEGSLEERRG